jgi:DNA-binding transcriptional LysR family regulator
MSVACLRADGARRNSEISDLTELRVFVAVVETANFSAAARRLNMTPSAVSRHITDLEAQLGALLVSRTTRHLVITEVGRNFYARCVNILEELGRATSEAEEQTRDVRGILRVTAPAVLAQRHIAPSLPKFLASFPSLSVDLLLTSTPLDLVAEGIDVAIRVAASVDDNFVAVRLAPNRRIFAASPVYLRQHGVPTDPSHLSLHNCLTMRADHSPAPWPMTIEGKAIAFRVKGNLTADNGEVLLEAALQGAGIAMLPMFLAGPYMRTRRLVSVLDAYTHDNTTIFAVLPHRRYVPSKSRSFIDFVKGIFIPTPPWER